MRFFVPIQLVEPLRPPLQKPSSKLHVILCCHLHHLVNRNFQYFCKTVQRPDSTIRRIAPAGLDESQRFRPDTCSKGAFSETQPHDSSPCLNPCPEGFFAHLFTSDLIQNNNGGERDPRRSCLSKRFPEPLPALEQCRFFRFRDADDV